jgi:hypothetical protein
MATTRTPPPVGIGRQRTHPEEGSRRDGDDPDPAVFDAVARGPLTDAAGTEVDGWKVHRSVFELAKHLRGGGPMRAEALLVRIVAVA